MHGMQAATIGPANSRNESGSNDQIMASLTVGPA